MSGSRHAARWVVLVQLVKTGWITGHAPTSDERHSAGGAAHVDGESIVQHPANPCLGDRPAPDAAVLVQPVGHRLIPGADTVSGTLMTIRTGNWRSVFVMIARELRGITRRFGSRYLPGHRAAPSLGDRGQ
jgi:hypothetical protein